MKTAWRKLPAVFAFLKLNLLDFYLFCAIDEDTGKLFII